MAGTPVTLYVGTHLLQAGDPLTPTPADALAERLRTDRRLRADTESLRNVRRLDARAYQQSKRRLPYFCVSGFRQNLRRIEAFEAAYAMPVDVDWGPTDVKLGRRLRAETAEDPNCALAYTSPSGRGWRLVFALTEPIAQVGLYRAVYHRLVSELAARYPALRGVDAKTHDPTRASFLSHDPRAAYRPEAEPVDWRSWLADLPPGVLGEVPASSSPTPGRSTPSPRPSVPYDAVRRALRPKPTRLVDRGGSRAYVPAEVLEMVPAWAAALRARGLVPHEEQRISYGMKVVCRARGREGVVNIFYGKRGYRFAIENRRGADAELAAEMIAVLEHALYESGDDLGEAGAGDYSEASFLRVGVTPAPPERVAAGAARPPVQAVSRPELHPRWLPRAGSRTPSASQTTPGARSGDAAEEEITW